jgi:hypothetical protein
MNWDEARRLVALYFRNANMLLDLVILEPDELGKNPIRARAAAEQMGVGHRIVADFIPPYLNHPRPDLRLWANTANWEEFKLSMRLAVDDGSLWN